MIFRLGEELKCFFFFFSTFFFSPTQRVESAQICTLVIKYELTRMNLKTCVTNMYLSFSPFLSPFTLVHDLRVLYE